MVGTQEPAIHNMFYHSELCKTLQNYLCCRNVHVSYYVIMLYHHVYSFVISKWHKKWPYLGASMIFPHLQWNTPSCSKNPAAAPAAPTALFDPRGRLRSASCHRMRRGHWAPRAAKGCRSRQRPWRGGAFGEPNGALFGDVEHGGKRTFIVGKEVLSLISWKNSRNGKMGDEWRIYGDDHRSPNSLYQFHGEMWILTASGPMDDHPSMGPWRTKRQCHCYAMLIFHKDAMVRTLKPGTKWNWTEFTKGFFWDFAMRRPHPISILAVITATHQQRAVGLVWGKKQMLLLLNPGSLSFLETICTLWFCSHQHSPTMVGKEVDMYRIDDFAMQHVDFNGFSQDQWSWHLWLKSLE